MLEIGEKKYRAAVERFEYIFDQLEQLKVQEVDRLEESNGVGVDFLDDDNDDVEIDNDDNATNEGMKKLDNYIKGLRHIVKSWLSLDLTQLGMILNSSKSSCLKNYANMVSNQLLLSRNPESIPA